MSNTRSTLHGVPMTGGSGLASAGRLARKPRGRAGLAALASALPAEAGDDAVTVPAHVVAPLRTAVWDTLFDAERDDLFDSPPVLALSATPPGARAVLAVHQAKALVVSCEAFAGCHPVLASASRCLLARA